MSEELLEWHAPCGVYCKRCPGVKVFNCNGCRVEKGQVIKKRPVCTTYKCVTSKGHSFCFECEDFPCELLQPIVNFGPFTPHNSKIYNLLMIKKGGIQEWNQICEEKSDLYYLARKKGKHGGEGLTIKEQEKK